MLKPTSGLIQVILNKTKAIINEKFFSSSLETFPFDQFRFSPDELHNRVTCFSNQCSINA
jgi:hypothetical protein